MAKAKFLIALALLMAWGPYLLFVWATAAVPGWAYAPGLRKALMLDRGFEPTVFTLLFGLGFSGVALFGLVGMLTGRGRFHH